jgi:hypothetical protein
LEPKFSYRDPVAIAAAVNPPASRQVFERLARLLNPPHNMALQPSRSRLKSSAYDGLADHCLVEEHKPDASKHWAYRACTNVIKRHSKSFYFSARLLPPGKRDGIMALYAFCRLSDDIVDSAVLRPWDSAAEAGTGKTEWRAISQVKINTILKLLVTTGSGHIRKSGRVACPRSQHPEN